MDESQGTVREKEAVVLFGVMNRAAAFFKWTCRADSVIIRVENIRERGIGHEADEAIGRSLRF